MRNLYKKQKELDPSPIIGNPSLLAWNISKPVSHRDKINCSSQFHQFKKLIATCIMKIEWISQNLYDITSYKLTSNVNFQATLTFLHIIQSRQQNGLN